MNAQPPPSLKPAFDHATILAEPDIAVFRTQQALRGQTSRPLSVRVSEELHLALGSYCEAHRVQKWALVETLCRSFLLEQEECERRFHRES